MRKLLLVFRGSETPELVGVEFQHEWLHDEVGCRQEVRTAHAGDFQWRAGPQALAVFLIKAVASVHTTTTDGLPFTLRDEPVAKTLRELFRKGDMIKLDWAATLFGYRAGRPPSRLIHDLIEVGGSNHHPRVQLQPHALSPRAITVQWDGEDVTRDRDRLDELAARLHRTCFGGQPKLLPPAEEGGMVTVGSETRQVAVTNDTVEIELVINGDFDTYSLAEQESLLRAISHLLATNQDIRVTRKRRGSVKLTLALTPEQAECLYWAVKRGDLTGFGVEDATLLSPLVPQREPPGLGSDFHQEFQRVGRAYYSRLSEVHVVQRRNSSQRYALKVLHSPDPLGPSFQELDRFCTEIAVLRRLRHPHIVSFIAEGHYSGSPCYVMEFCGGGTLADKFRGAPPPPAQTAELLAQLGSALLYMQGMGVLHRDLKPENCLLTDTGLLKVGDFSLAKLVDDTADVTVTGQVLGTPAFMSPEQFAGTQTTWATDVWGFGVVTYELLTGCRLLHDVGGELVLPSSVQHGVPKGLEDLCMRCLRKFVGDRPSLQEVMEQLAQFLSTTAR